MRDQPRSETIAETTPLLPQAYWPSQDLPVSVRLSPPLFLDQRALLSIRATIAVYLSVVFVLDMFYGLSYTSRGKHFAYEASNISLVIQIVYYWITTSWALQHYLATYGRFPPEEQAKGKLLAQIQTSLSGPTSTDTKSIRYLAFLTFYAASVTFPFVITIVFWQVLYPAEHVPDHGGKGEALHRFVLISIAMLNSVIALVEILVLSSVRKQKDLATELAGIIAIYLLYGMWTVLGHSMTGEYVYKYYDPDYAGWRGVATTDIVVLSLTVTVFFAQRELHGLRKRFV